MFLPSPLPSPTLFFYLRAMKWILGLLLFISLLSACSNELIVTDKWKDISIVWGILSKSDTAHYIRVEKAFLDPNTSAHDIARIPDSLYYDDAVVTLKRVNSGQVFTLERINGDLEGYPRETGDFAEIPNYLYKIKANVINLVVGEKYEFSLQKSDQSAPVVAQTIILAKPTLRTPSPGSSLPFKSGSNYKFDWTDVTDAGIYDLKLQFNYVESDSTGNPFVPKTFEWNIESGIDVSDFTINGADFFSAVKANVEEDFDAKRIFKDIDIDVWCGGKELKDFLKIANANSGLTSTQDVPVYTNLSDGLGIFTSRNVSYNNGFSLTPQALDSLKNGSITGNLNFK